MWSRFPQKFNTFSSGQRERHKNGADTSQGRQCEGTRATRRQVCIPHRRTCRMIATRVRCVRVVYNSADPTVLTHSTTNISQMKYSRMCHIRHIQQQTSQSSQHIMASERSQMKFGKQPNCKWTYLALHVQSCQVARFAARKRAG
jgi:hypothetical protein